MIICVPLAQDFWDAGVEYLNLAWDDALSIEHDRQSWRPIAEKEDPEAAAVLVHMEQRARKRLSVCASLVHQAAELLVKHDIALVSPFLLLDQPAKASGNRDEDIEFGSLKTVDSGMLRQLHERVSKRRLPDDFWAFFDVARKRRNGFMHGVGSVPPAGLVLAGEVVSLSEQLLGQQWPVLRRSHVMADPLILWDHHGALKAGLNDEFGLMLKNDVFRRHVGLTPGERTYFCAACFGDDIEPDHPVALLRSGRLECLACGETTTFEATKCGACGSAMAVDERCAGCGGVLGR